MKTVLARRNALKTFDNRSDSKRSMSRAAAKCSMACSSSRLLTPGRYASDETPRKFPEGRHG